MRHVHAGNGAARSPRCPHPTERFMPLRVALPGAGLAVFLFGGGGTPPSGWAAVKREKRHGGYYENRSGQRNRDTRQDAGAAPDARPRGENPPAGWAGRAGGGEHCRPRPRRLGAAGPRGGLRGLEHKEILRDGDAPASAGVCLAAGADLKVRAKYGSTPLHYAAGLTATPAVIVALITAGADLKARDKYGRTPLHRAAGSNRTSSVIVTLLDAGADPKARTADGRTPWDVAQGNAALKDTAA